jgi:hypothetical protein
MLKKIILFLLTIGNAYGQNSDIKITDETKNNRLSVYALNQSETDYDVKITITGKNIRQSSAKPRFIRVPAASKVLLKSLIIERKKQPSYTYELEVNDSLSRRALKPPAKPIRINPKKQIVLYLSDYCQTCDSVLNGLNNSKYIFTTINLSEKRDVKERMKTYLEGTIPSLDTLVNPVISLGGVLHTKIDNYNLLLEELNKAVKN